MKKACSAQRRGDAEIFKCGIKIQRPKIKDRKLKSKLRSFAFICGFIFLSLFICLFWLKYEPQKVSAADESNKIENALFTRQEFFGAEAIVPLPTFEAREKLAELIEARSRDLEIMFIPTYPTPQDDEAEVNLPGTAQDVRNTGA